MDDALHLDALAARDRIRGGALRGRALVDVIERVPFRDRDAFVDVALGIDEVPDDVALPRGAVPYVPCNVDAILHAIVDAPIGAHDVFCDYGAGVGRVALLVHLLTGARVRGVELQPQLVERAHTIAHALGVDVDITLGDARDFDARATVHFVYASFDATVLQRVLDRIERGVFVAVGFDVHHARFHAMTSSSPEVALYSIC